MARNASGTYTLPSGNPVVSGTLIDATWANNTLSDLGNEMTDSLSRSGEGAMLAPLRITDGVQATPSLAFSNEPSSGLYRAGSNEWWAVAAGVQNLRFTNTGLTTRAAAGAVGTPSIAAFNDTDTGIYFPGANELAIATGGAARMTFDSAGAVAVPGTFSVTGNFAVDTNVLFVDAASNNVGIGTASPANYANYRNLAISGTTGANIDMLSGSTKVGNLFNDATNFYAYNVTAGALVFGTNNAEVGRFTAAGNLGIGTTSPADSANFGRALDIQSSTGAAAYFRDSDDTTKFAVAGFFGSDSNAYYGSYGTGTGTLFFTGGAERARIDSSGNLLLGGTSTAQLDGVFGQLIGSSSKTSAGIALETQYGAYMMYTDSTDSLIFWDSGDNAARATINASGNLGVGATSPSATFRATVQGVGTSGNPMGGILFRQGATDVFSISPISTDNTTDVEFWNYQNGYMRFGTNNAERARIASDGRFVSNAAAARISVEPATGTNSAFVSFTSSAGANGSYVGIDSSVGGLGTGGYSMALWHGANYPLVFATNNTERGRFTAAGDLLVGITGNDDPSSAIVRAGMFSGQRSASASTVFQAWNQATTGDNIFVQFYTEGGGGTLRGSIDYNRAGGLVRYNTTSDYRAKDVYGLLDDSGETIDALKVYRGKMHGATMERPMLIAHEAQEAAPYAVTGEKDAVNEDGTPKFQQMDTSSLVPLLIAEIQSLRSRVAALEAQ